MIRKPSLVSARWSFVKTRNRIGIYTINREFITLDEYRHRLYYVIRHTVFGQRHGVYNNMIIYNGS